MMITVLYMKMNGNLIHAIGFSLPKGEPKLCHMFGSENLPSLDRNIR